jgi:hypothetical protein
MRTTTAREPHKPAPDLLDYRVVLRAMTSDLARLAVVAENSSGLQTGGACDCYAGICAGSRPRSENRGNMRRWSWTGRRVCGPGGTGGLIESA